MSVSGSSFCNFSSTLRHNQLLVSAETAGTSGRITLSKSDDISFILFLRVFCEGTPYGRVRCCGHLNLLVLLGIVF